MKTELVHHENILVYMDYYNEETAFFTGYGQWGGALLEALAKKKASDAIRKSDLKWNKKGHK